VTRVDESAVRNTRDVDFLSGGTIWPQLELRSKAPALFIGIRPAWMSSWMGHPPKRAMPCV